MALKDGQKNFERLFLLELLVDHVVISNSKLDLDPNLLASLGPVVVRFQFLTYPPVEIREEDFTPSTKPLGEEKRILLKSGRSCMFSLSSKKSGKICETDFDIFINIFRNKHGKLEEKQAGGEISDNSVFIGATKINMNDTMTDLICKSEGPKANEKMTHTKTAALKFVDHNNLTVGKIVFLIRVSCFGYMIVTGFQLSEEDKEKFRGKYKNIMEFPSASEIPRGSKVVPPKDKTDKDGKGKDDKGKDDKKPEKKPEDRPKEDEPSGRDQKPGRPVCPFGFPRPAVCECCPCQRLAGLGRGPTPYNLPYTPQQGQFGQTPYQYSGSPQQGSISAPGISPPSIGPGQGKTKDVDMDPGSVAIRGNQLVFKMPDKSSDPVPVEGKFASSVYYTMGDEKQEGPRNVIQILPQNPPPVTGEELGGTYDKQDVLVLKLGKKRMAAGKKPKLELELRTPKMKAQKPETDTQQTQYLLSDIPKPSKKPGSAKSSKKGGSKKGGKGKKK